jgi:uncharacterized protein YndB with AHSA1/START domain
MIKKIGAGLLAILAIILVMALMQPDSFSVKRSATIKAPPEKIVALVGDFRQWSSWSPWEHLDPKMQRTFAGAPNGTGAVYSWQGNDDVGAGRMEIVELAAPSKVVIKLDFKKPIESHNTTDFTMLAQGADTTVTWHMTGPMPFLTKIVSVFMSMDAMIGRDFEKGLANLKAVAEK